MVELTTTVRSQSASRKDARRNNMNAQQLSMADLPRMFLGFDRMQNQFLNSGLDTAYPRYNVIKRGATGYLIEVAVPGWDKKDLEINLHKNVLTIKGTKKQTTSDTEVYLHKGLSGKCFTKTFTVGEYIELDSAYMQEECYV